MAWAKGLRSLGMQGAHSPMGEGGSGGRHTQASSLSPIPTGSRIALSLTRSIHSDSYLLRLF